MNPVTVLSEQPKPIPTKAISPFSVHCPPPEHEGTNPCSVNNGDCSQLCLPTSETTRSCMCTAGYSLRSGQQACEGQFPAFPLYLTLTPSTLLLHRAFEKDIMLPGGFWVRWLSSPPSGYCGQKVEPENGASIVRSWITMCC